MPTINPRVNVTLDPDLAAVLFDLSKREKESVSAMAKKLIQEALEHYEDLALSKIAEKRDTKNAKWIEHDTFWRKALRD